jgi:hypothetical protein
MGCGQPYQRNARNFYLFNTLKCDFKGREIGSMCKEISYTYMRSHVLFKCRYCLGQLPYPGVPLS